MTKLTYTKIAFMHGRCRNMGCPVCRNAPIPEIDEWLRKHVTVGRTGAPKSPWWEVAEPNRDCYRKLRGDLRPPGYYDTNPTAQ